MALPREIRDRLSLPAVAAPQEKLPKDSAPDMFVISDPGVAPLTVVTPRLEVAVAATAGKRTLHALIAAARLAAAVPTTVLLTKFPEAALAHPFVSEPPLSAAADQVKPLVKL